MEQRDPAKLAEKYLEAADSCTKSSWKVFVSALVATALLWHGSIDPLAPRLNALWSASSASRSSLATLKNYRIAIDKGEKGGERLDRLELNAAKSMKVRKDEAARAAVAFSIPGLPSLNVSTRYAATFWCALVGALLCYLYSSRATVLANLARGARLLRDTEPERFPFRPASTYEPQWWLLPLPSKDGESVTATQFRTFLHVPNARQLSMGVIALFLVVFALQIRVAMIASAGIASLGNGQRFSAEDAFVLALTGAAVALIPIISVLWHCPAKVPDALPPANAGLQTRRAILASGLALVAATAITTTAVVRLGPKRLVSWIRSPRHHFRPNSSYVSVRLPAGFYLNRKSDKVHQVLIATQEYRHSALKPGEPYVDGVRVPPARRPNPANYQALSTSLPLKSLAELVVSAAAPRRGRLIERLSEQIFASGKFDDGLQLLLKAVKADLADLQAVRRSSPNTRLYYLLARQAIRYNRIDLLNEMMSAISLSSNVSLFQAATRSWTEPSSRWRRRLPFEKH